MTALARRPAPSPGPLLTGFFRIMELWGVDNDTARVLLGSPAERTYFRWKAGDISGVPADTVRRIGYVSGIWKALQIVYSDPTMADGWLKRPNRHFGGQTPLA